MVPVQLFGLPHFVQFQRDSLGLNFPNGKEYRHFYMMIPLYFLALIRIQGAVYGVCPMAFLAPAPALAPVFPCLRDARCHSSVLSTAPVAKTVIGNAGLRLERAISGTGVGIPVSMPGLHPGQRRWRRFSAVSGSLAGKRTESRLAVNEGNDGLVQAREGLRQISAVRGGCRFSIRQSLLPVCRLTAAFRRSGRDRRQSAIRNTWCGR
jgi:hypothetical protein